MMQNLLLLSRGMERKKKGPFLAHPVFKVRKKGPSCKCPSETDWGLFLPFLLLPLTPPQMAKGDQVTRIFCSRRTIGALPEGAAEKYFGYSDARKCILPAGEIKDTFPE